MEQSPLQAAGYDALKAEIGALLEQGRAQALKSFNTILVQTYWHIGRHIIEFEQGGQETAAYGTNLLARLSKDLTLEFGKGFGRSNLFYMRKLYLAFQNSGTLSHKLSWGHYYEILKAENKLEIGFYIKQCEQENWSVRELKRQMKSMLFHRLALSQDKKGVMKLSQKGAQVSKPSDIIKDPYIFEFLGIPEPYQFLESDLEERLILNLEKFLLELGKGFAFVGRQYRVPVGNRQFRVDLVFYHRILKCFILFDLKRGEIDHEDIGQMNFYLNYFAKEENMPDDNPPIGVVLGAYKDEVLVEYALESITSQLFVSKYQLYLPDKAQLAAVLEHVLDSDPAQQDL